MSDLTANQHFDVIIGNFSELPLPLPKGTVVGYARLNPLALLTPERRVSEAIGKVLNVRTIPMER